MTRPLTHADLELLSGWPVGTHGHAADMELLNVLNELCKRHGYGMISQLAQWIEELWRNCEGTFEWFEALRAERLVTAEQARVAHHGTPEEKAKLFGGHELGGES